MSEEIIESSGQIQEVVGPEVDQNWRNNMSCWSKVELENMLEDVVNELNLSDAMIAKHGPIGTPPSELLRLVLQQKDRTIRNLRAGFREIKM